MATEKCLKDANALIAEFEWLQSQVSSTTALEIQEHIQRIKDAPTVDAVEVVHGRWVLAKPRVKGRNATYRCTVCGKLRSSYYNDVFQWEYGPCGAKMDGDGNG